MATLNIQSFQSRDYKFTLDCNYPIIFSMHDGDLLGNNCVQKNIYQVDMARMSALYTRVWWALKYFIKKQ